MRRNIRFITKDGLLSKVYNEPLYSIGPIRRAYSLPRLGVSIDEMWAVEEVSYTYREYVFEYEREDVYYFKER